MADDQQGTGPGGASTVPRARRPRVGPTVATLASSLWFPVLFFLGFLFCYLLAFHNPTPQHIRVAVPGPAAGSVRQGLEKAVPGGFTVVRVDSPEAAQRAVRSRDVVGAYVADPSHPHLYTAKAGGFELVAVLQQTFTPLAERGGGSLAQTDLAPTAPGDGMGTSLFYLCLAWTIPSYVMVMMMLRATSFGRAKKVATFVVTGAVISVAGFYIGLAMDIIRDRPLVMLFAFLLTQAISLTAYGLVPFVRQFSPGVAMLLFVLLSIPSSGGAIPIEMVPAFFRHLHPYMPMGNLIDAERNLMYFRGASLVHPVAVLCCWVAAGIVLITLGWWMERRIVARERAAGEGEAAAADVEADVEDPALEMPQPAAVTAHTHRIGASAPMLTGHVTDGSGMPLKGVQITLRDTGWTYVVRTLTDHHGQYGFTGLPEGYADVMAQGRGKVPAVKRVLARAGHVVRQDFRLRPRPGAAQPPGDGDGAAEP